VSAGSTGDNTEKTTAIVSYCNGITSDDAVSIIAGTKFAYEPFTDQTVAVNMASDLAGLNCRTSAKERPWVSAAGLRRGKILNWDRIYYAPNKENRDTLFKKKINPVIKDDGEFFLFGDLTHIDAYTPTESIGAKRTVMIVENFLSELGPQFLYKINDTQTRIQFTTITSQFLDKLKELGGLNDFRVVCDTTNNTQEIIDAGQFIGDVYIKVAKSIYYIILNFNTSRYKTNTITIR
jgi:phage tail sheath protein FI